MATAKKSILDSPNGRKKTKRRKREVEEEKDDVDEECAEQPEGVGCTQQ